MRILHIIDSGGLYGAEAIVLNLMEVHKRMGHHPMLLSLGDLRVGPKGIEVEAENRGFETYSLRFRNGLNLNGSMKILHYAWDLGAQIIHSHGYKGDILLGIIPQRCRKIPVVTTLHGWTSTRLFSKIRIYEWMDALFITRLDKIAVVSSAMRDHRRLRMLGIRPAVIHNGIPLLDFEPGIFRRQCLEVAKSCENKFKIIFVGRLSPEKGVNDLIRAIAKIVSRGINACLVLVGEGSEKSSLRRLAVENGLSDRVHFVGYREKAYQLFPYFDLFVLPSYAEGLPITLLEAMQSGVPVVATNVGEIPRVLDFGEYGEIVEPGNPERLANAIEKVCRNREEAMAKASAAKVRVLEEYSVEKMANQYLEIYKDLISKRGKITEPRGVRRIE